MRNVKAIITLPMEFPEEWTDEQIWFYLNESSWCASNFLDLAEKFDEEHGCICNICEFEVMPDA